MMGMTEALLERFAQLSEQFTAALATRRHVKNEYTSGYQIEKTVFIEWCVKARNLLAMACGKDSVHFQSFIELEKKRDWRSDYTALEEVGAVFRAAKEDFTGGHIISIRNLVQADVFDTELEQAQELLSMGYYSAAAVIAGVVLETTLRQLCADRKIAPAKLDKMNADLAKAGLYNTLIQKRITALADIRNKAAHGHSSQFTPADVADMISYVGHFVADRL